MSFADATTRIPDAATSDGAPEPVVVLTILVHPEPSRIGECAFLLRLSAGGSAVLGRNDPDFAAPGRHFGSPLEDVFLSREPMHIRAYEGGVELCPERCPSAIRVAAEAEALTGPRRIANDVLEQGITIDLASRVLLLLHRRTPTPLQPSSGRHGMVGASAALVEVQASIDRVAGLDVSVLLRGESGTGKELVARAIHQASDRCHEPFVAVNLGALPSTLAAAEIFGAVKGAFTGAVGSRQGYLRAAGRGTLFLDEVGEASPEVQALLLRALESGEYFPLGSEHPRHLEARLVAATDSDLERRSREGDFKEPLLHRLASYEIWLPALRERLDDLGRLFLHFANQEQERLELAGVPAGADPDGVDADGADADGVDPDEVDGSAPPWCPTALMARWARHPWPGNVRELRNLVRQVVIDSRGLPQLRTSPRLEKLLAPETETARDSDRPPADERGGRRPREIEEHELLQAMRAENFEPAAAARRLGISRSSIYNRIHAHPTLRTAEAVPEAEFFEVLESCGGDPKAAARALEVSARGLRRRLP